MSPRSPTNTLIITNVSNDILQNPTPLLEFLSYDLHLMELVSLPKFERILIMCESSQLSKQLRKNLKSSPDWNHLRITYSIKDNNLSIIQHPEYLTHQNSNQYLELPLEVGSKRFLISPPLSPHTEWDEYDKVEEGPNSKTVFSPQELSHLLWERLGGFDSSQVRKYQEQSDEEEEEETNQSDANYQYSNNSSSNKAKSNDQHFDISEKPEILFEDIDNGVPAIVLDSVNHRDDDTLSTNQAKLNPPKTAMPPPSL